MTQTEMDESKRLDSQIWGLIQRWELECESIPEELDQRSALYWNIREAITAVRLDERRRWDWVDFSEKRPPDGETVLFEFPCDYGPYLAVGYYSAQELSIVDLHGDPVGYEPEDCSRWAHLMVLDVTNDERHVDCGGEWH